MTSYSTENELEKNVSVAALESALAHLQEANRRMATDRRTREELRSFIDRM